MQAAVFLGDGELVVTDLETPTVAAGEVLIRIDSNTICGTDLRIASGAKTVSVPRTLGHEAAGTIVAVGAGVVGLTTGDLVGVTPTQACNRCPSCLDGNFHMCEHARVLGHEVDGSLAEFLLVPRSAVERGNVVVADPRLSPEEVSLTEPLSCVLHAQRLIGIDVDDSVLIVGGGAIGQLHAQLARVHGARTVIVSEPVESRRILAERLGASITVDPTSEDLAQVVAEATGGRGVDVVILCIGVPQLINQALDLAARRGRVSLFAGFPKDAQGMIDANRIHYKELTITGSSNSTVAEYRAALRLIESRRVDVASLVTHRVPLSRIHDALAVAGSPEAIKVAVIPAMN